MLIGRRYNEGARPSGQGSVEIRPRADAGHHHAQNYFRLYDKLAGMTGGGRAARDLQAGRGHPINMPDDREDQSDLIYKTERPYIAVVDDVAEALREGTAGAPSAPPAWKRSGYLSRQFTKRRIPHNVLNAKYHEPRGDRIAVAGRRGASPSATNMAGRGTDVTSAFSPIGGCASAAWIGRNARGTRRPGAPNCHRQRKQGGQGSDRR